MFESRPLRGRLVLHRGELHYSAGKVPGMLGRGLRTWLVPSQGSHTANLGESFEVVPEILAYVCTDTSLYLHHDCVLLFQLIFTKGRCPLDPRRGDHSNGVITPRPTLSPHHNLKMLAWVGGRKCDSLTRRYTTAATL